MKRNLKIFSSYWFITGLILLLLNDFIFKGLYGNWLTGKLSDFAGLFVFSLFLTAFFPKYKTNLFLLTGTMFIYWKSPFSQFIIDFWNSLNFISISRVVDYSDLISLSILPLAFHIDSIKDKIRNIRLSPIIPLTFSIFAFVATSKNPEHLCFLDNDGAYKVKKQSREQLIKDLRNCDIDITFSEFNSSNKEYAYAVIHNMNDSIPDLELKIGQYNKSDSTVELTIECMHGPGLKKLNETNKLMYKSYIKKIFERKVINKINKNAP